MVCATQCNHKSIVTRLHAPLGTNTSPNNRKTFPFFSFEHFFHHLHGAKGEKSFPVLRKIWLFIRLEEMKAVGSIAALENGDQGPEPPVVGICPGHLGLYRPLV